MVSPWDRFAAHGATPVNHPVTNPAAAAQQRTTAGGTAARSPGDPWARFEQARGTTAGAAPRTHAVTVIDGTTSRTTRVTTGTAATHTVHATGTADVTVPRRTTDAARPQAAAPHPVQRAEPVHERSTTTTSTTVHGEAQHAHAVRPPG